MNPTLIKNYLAGGAIEQYRIVKPGADDDHVVKASAATDALLGVTGTVGADAAEEPIDVIHTGIAEIKSAGNISFGDLVTSDANGMAVVASPASGVNNGVVGRALRDAVSGDIFPVLLAIGQVQG